MTKRFLAPLLLLALVLPTAAQAQNSEIPLESKKFMNAGLGFGWHFLQDDSYQGVYGDKGRFLTKLQFGVVPWSKYVHVEINGTFSFTQFTGQQQLSISGGSSADDIMFTLMPIGVDLLVGIDIAYEQPVVPFGGIGFNYTVFRENEPGDGGASATGYRFGPSFFFGGAFLLDWIERGRASEVDSKAGINDAFFTIEGRYNQATKLTQDGAIADGPFTLRGWQVTMGVKLVI